MLRIVTDSASDFTQAEILEKNIEMVNLSINFVDKSYESHQDDARFSVFYDLLMRAETLPTTSQPAPGQYAALYEDAKAKGDDMIVICLSGGLSGTYQSASIAREMVGYDRIFVIDSRQAIMALRAVVDYAIDLRDRNESTESIVDKIENIKEDVVVFGAVQTLKYLQMGGRLSKASAVVGNLLTIKPIITLEDGKVVMTHKTRGRKAAMRYLESRLIELGYHEDHPVYFGYSRDYEAGKVFMDETVEKFGIKNYRGPSGIGGTIGTHVGEDGIAVAFFLKKEKAPE